MLFLERWLCPGAAKGNFREFLELTCGEELVGRLRDDAKLCVCVPHAQRCLVGAISVIQGVGALLGSSRAEGIWAMSALVEFLLPVRAECRAPKWEGEQEQLQEEKWQQSPGFGGA